MAQNNYSQNGVTISKSPITVGDEVTLTYQGHLAKSGAESVYVQMGYGENWDEKQWVTMQKEKNGGFKAKIKVNHPGKLNMVFKKDGEDWESSNWDNNNSSNYSFPITGKQSSTTSKQTTTPKITSKEVVKTTTTKVAAKPSTKVTVKPVVKSATKSVAKPTTKSATKTETKKASTTSKPTTSKTSKTPSTKSQTSKSETTPKSTTAKRATRK